MAISPRYEDETLPGGSYSEDTLVQQTTAAYMAERLGAAPVDAFE